MSELLTRKQCEDRILNLKKQITALEETKMFYSNTVSYDYALFAQQKYLQYQRETPVDVSPLFDLSDMD